MGTDFRAATTIALLNPASAANTAAATSAWKDITQAEGDISIIVSVGAITGSIVVTVEHADDSSGTNGAAFTPDDGAFPTITANSVNRRVIDSRSIKGFIRVVGTITTGPVLIGANATFVPDEPVGAV